eukprot:GSA25T00004147001.1
MFVLVDCVLSVEPSAMPFWVKRREYEKTRKTNASSVDQGTHSDELQRCTLPPCDNRGGERISE